MPPAIPAARIAASMSRRWIRPSFRPGASTTSTRWPAEIATMASGRNERVRSRSQERAALKPRPQFLRIYPVCIDFSGRTYARNCRDCPGKGVPKHGRAEAFDSPERQPIVAWQRHLGERCRSFGRSGEAGSSRGPRCVFFLTQGKKIREKKGKAFRFPFSFLLPDTHTSITICSLRIGCFCPNSRKFFPRLWLS